MKFFKGFTRFLLTLSYIALGILLFSHFDHDFLNLFQKIRFPQALIIILGISNVLHIKYLFLSHLMHKRMKKSGKFDNFIDDKFNHKGCTGKPVLL